MNDPQENVWEILLFDMDGVLLVPAGYHRALQETVARVGRALGFPEAHLTHDAIAQFEAAGATSEWDSSAMCTALLLNRLWERSPEVRFTPAAFASPLPPHKLPLPDFLAFARALADAVPANAPPLTRAKSLLIDRMPRRPPGQTAHLRELLDGAREFDRSITHRLFQELVLGSEMYLEIYGRAPFVNHMGFLAAYDQPTLDRRALADLNSWLRSPNRRAAIFTNRPTREPGGHAGTPEGELGQKTTGFQRLPLIGWGQLTWLSNARGLADEAFSKPAPAHALAALRGALGDPIPEALQAAADLQMGLRSTGWEALAGARISAFEDGAAGLVSARAAGRLLAQHGISTEVRLYGISQEPVKQKALAEVGGQVFPHIASALQTAGVLKN